MHARRLVRTRALESYIGAHRTTIYRWQFRLNFPQPLLKTSTSAIYDLDHIDAWLDLRQHKAEPENAR